jgi:WD40 repeat protein
MPEPGWIERFPEDPAPEADQGDISSQDRAVLELARRLADQPFRPAPARQADLRARLLVQAQGELPARRRQHIFFQHIILTLRGIALAILILVAIFTIDWLFGNLLPEPQPVINPPAPAIKPTPSSVIAITPVPSPVATQESAGSLSDHTSVPADVIARGEELPFDVCGEAPDWSRPTEQEQKDYILSSGRYSGIDQGVVTYLWSHDFLINYGSASINQDIRDLSGLWTLRGGYMDGCLTPEREDAVLKLKSVELWSLLHRVLRIQRLGSDYAITVAPADKGVQFVQFPRPEDQKPITFYFVSVDGRLIERLNEAESVYFPYPRSQVLPLSSTIEPTVIPTRTAQTPPVAPPLSESARWGEGVARTLSYFPGGKSFTLVSSLGVSIYNAATLEKVQSFPGDSGWYNAAVSPDGTLMAWSLGALVDIKQLPGGETLRSYLSEDGVVGGLQFSPDGRLLAALVRPPGDEVYNRILKLIRVSDATLVASWDIGTAWDVAFAPDGKTLYAWYPMSAQGVRRWSVPEGRVLPTDEMFAWSLAPSPDGRWFAVGGGNGAIEIRDAGDGALVRSLSGSEGSTAVISALIFSPDGSLLAGSYSDQFVRVWRVEDGTLLQSFERSSGSSPFLAFSPDAATLALPAADGIQFRRVTDGALMQTLAGNQPQITAMAVSPSGDRVAALLGDGNPDTYLAIWKMDNSKAVWTISQPQAISLAWSPDGMSVAVGYFGGYLAIFRASDGVLIATPGKANNNVQDLAFSPDGRLLASSAMGTVRLWDMQDWKTASGFSTRGGWIDQVAFSPDGKLLAAYGLQGGYVYLWQVADGRLLWQQAAGEDGYSGSLAFSADGSTLAVSAHDAVTLWRVSDGEKIDQFNPGSWVTHLALSPQASLAAISLQSGAIRVYRLPDWHLMYVAGGHNGEVTGLEFTPGGRSLVSSSQDGTLRVWQIPQQ